MSDKWHITAQIIFSSSWASRWTPLLIRNHRHPHLLRIPHHPRTIPTRRLQIIIIRLNYRSHPSGLRFPGS